MYLQIHNINRSDVCWNIILSSLSLPTYLHIQSDNPRYPKPFTTLFLTYFLHIAMPVLRACVTPTRQLLPSPPLTPDTLRSSTPSPASPLRRAKPGRLRSSRPRCVNGHARCTDPICVKYRDAPETFLVPEIMEAVLSQASFPTVMAVSRVNQYGRSLAQREIRVRIRDVLAPFVDEDQFDGFMQALQALGGGIIGSHARRLLALKSKVMDDAFDMDPDHPYHRSTNLNLVVLKGALDKAKDCLEAIGYSEWCHPNVDRPYREVVKSLVVGVKHVKDEYGETVSNDPHCA
ncbi:hypothetical protein EST38_g11541 [Candolleomyces aberdarensis]|uniref:Uncharacterized protein n=1 Tax=Candolleomyces aberdarensis TaxID=2316362 RepID=A0A4Q2D4L2_9AGAR|nr:hypothetical protein EST38_g11541 [Candolleomyces aberdarensis]